MPLHQPYYTLVSSLPRLVHFEHAKELPINRVRLDQRLMLLHPTDVEQLASAEALLEWQYQSLTCTDATVCCQYHNVMQQLTNPSLRRFIQFRLTLRMVMVVLRTQHNSEENDGAPKRGTNLMQLDARMRRILAHGDNVAAKLKHVFPWLEVASSHLQQHRAIDLERLLMQVVWRYAEGIGEQYLFRFEHVFAYVFQWDIVARWLGYRAAAAQQRFTALQEEITDGHC